MITALRVKNFRSLKNVSIDLGLRNVFIGPNLSGKSNILDVFRFLRDMVLVADPSMPGVTNAFLRRLGFFEVAWKGAESQTVSIALEGRFPSEIVGGSRSQPSEVELGAPEAWKYDVTFFAAPNGWANVRRESLVFDVAGQGPVKIIEATDGIRKLTNIDGRHVSQVDDLNRSALEFEIPDWDGNRLRAMLRNLRFYRLAPALMRNVNPTAATNVLQEQGENLSAWLMTLQTRYRETFERLVQATRDVFPEIEQLYAWTTEQSTVFAVAQEKDLKRRTVVSQMSDGQLCFIALASLIFAPLELGAPLYCVEEPENHLHPKLMQTLFALLNQRQDELGVSKSGQLAIATHSPHVIDQFTLDDLIVVSKTRGESVTTRPREKKHLRALLASEEAGLGQLYYSGSLS